MQLDWETYGDFPISVEKTVEVKIIFTANLTACIIQFYDTHSRTDQSDRADNIKIIKSSPCN